MGKGRVRNIVKNQWLGFLKSYRVSQWIYMLIISLISFFLFSLFFTQLYAWSNQEGKIDLLGIEWNGNENREWDFTLIRRGSSNTFDYYATSRKNTRKKIKGEVVIDLFRYKVKIRKLIEGKNINICDGIFSTDKKFISGICYDLNKQMSEVVNTYSWWATVEQSKKSKIPSFPLNINLATVKELETYLYIDSVTSRNIIEHKLSIGRYKDIQNLVDSNIISAETFERIKQWISVR